MAVARSAEAAPAVEVPVEVGRSKKYFRYLLSVAATAFLAYIALGFSGVWMYPRQAYMTIALEQTPAVNRWFLRSYFLLTPAPAKLHLSEAIIYCPVWHEDCAKIGTEVLKHHPGEIDQKTMGGNTRMTPLHVAVVQKNFGAIEFLVNSGADVEALTENTADPTLHSLSALALAKKTGYGTQELAKLNELLK